MSTIKKAKSPAANKAFDLEERLLKFAVASCEIAESLPSTGLGKHITNQLIRSCTSPAPNYGEAQSAESRKDFIHKLKLCLKELRESQVWLRLIEMKKYKVKHDVPKIWQEADELISIFVKSVQTAESNLESQKSTRS